MVAMSKLLVNFLRDALDTPVFKFYYVPIDKTIKLDAQTKVEGVVTATATLIAGGLIVLINQFPFSTCSPSRCSRYRCSASGILLQIVCTRATAIRFRILCSGTGPRWKAMS